MLITRRFTALHTGQFTRLHFNISGRRHGHFAISPVGPVNPGWSTELGRAFWWPKRGGTNCDTRQRITHTWHATGQFMGHGNHAYRQLSGHGAHRFQAKRTRGQGVISTTLEPGANNEQHAEPRSYHRAQNNTGAAPTTHHIRGHTHTHTRWAPSSHDSAQRLHTRHPTQ